MGEAQLFSTAFFDDSLRMGDAVRATGSVHCAMLPNGIRAWVISQYDDARTALADPALSKDATGLTRVIRRQFAETGQGAPLNQMVAPHMLFNDDPTHARLRALVAAKFTRPRIKTLLPRIEQITASLLDAAAITDGPVDLIEQLAFPLPVTVICELLGVPEADRVLLREWTGDMMSGKPARIGPADQAMAGYFAELIDSKRTKPGDDLLSALVQIAGDEDRLSPSELLGTVFLLFVAGHETTTNLIGNSARWLLADPARWQLLHREPQLLPAAVEELLRFDAPARLSTHRWTTRAVKYGGVTIPADEVVLISLQAANRDSSRFDDADQLDLRRDATGHLSFGYGIHYCLGAQLGKMEAEVALGMLTARFPHARLAVAEQDLRRRRNAFLNGYVSLPLLLAG